MKWITKGAPNLDIFLSMARVTLLYPLCFITQSNELTFISPEFLGALLFVRNVSLRKVIYSVILAAYTLVSMADQTDRTLKVMPEADHTWVYVSLNIPFQGAIRSSSSWRRRKPGKRSSRRRGRSFWTWPTDFRPELSEWTSTASGRPKTRSLSRPSPTSSKSRTTTTLSEKRNR